MTTSQFNSKWNLSIYICTKYQRVRTNFTLLDSAHLSEVKEKLAPDVHFSRGKLAVLVRLEGVWILQQYVGAKVCVIAVVSVQTHRRIEECVDRVIGHSENLRVLSCVRVCPGHQDISSLSVPVTEV